MALTYFYKSNWGKKTKTIKHIHDQFLAPNCRFMSSNCFTDITITLLKIPFVFLLFLWKKGKDLKYSELSQTSSFFPVTKPRSVLYSQNENNWFKKRHVICISLILFNNRDVSSSAPPLLPPAHGDGLNFLCKSIFIHLYNYTPNQFYFLFPFVQTS